MSTNHKQQVQPIFCILSSCVLVAISSQAWADHLVLPEIEVTTEKPFRTPQNRIQNGNAALLIQHLPGISLYQGGGVSSLPVIRGLADDRIRVKVDGMDLISACANHMNPPLSYIDPSNIESIQVFAGISPVSLGGDSIAGAIVVKSAKPTFARSGQDLVINGQINTFYHSNNDARGVNLSTSIANESVSLRYTGSTVEANNFRAGSAFKNAGPAAVNASTDRSKDRGRLAADEVGSTYYQAHNQALALAVMHENHLLDVKLGWQSIPEQGFVNQRMDMTGNESRMFNVGYTGNFGWGDLTARTYHERTKHSMQFGNDKLFWYGPTGSVPGMPMETRGSNTGAIVKGDIKLGDHDTLAIGAEYQRYRLDDYWRASPPGLTLPTMMGPNTFLNINNGQRDRYDVFAEWDAQWSKDWSTNLGLRSSTVKMDTDKVQGYNSSGGMMGYGNPNSPFTIPGAFNAADRTRTDHNFDLTALARFMPNDSYSLEGGYALKTRSPNLYERFAWSNNNTMVMNMVNLVGDGNGYVGNLNLSPEKAHTVSVTASMHDATKQDWQLNITPYFTYVDDFIDAVSCASIGKVCPSRSDGFSNLSLDNQSAALYGADIAGRIKLFENNGFGSVDAKGVINYVRGKNKTTHDDLYNIMPLNATLTLEHRFGGWTNSLQAILVSRKDQVQAIRNEIETAGFGLLNVFSSFDWKHARVDFAITNLLDKGYANPLGGAYLGQGATMGTGVLHGTQVPGMGRSVNVGLTLVY